MDAKTVVWLVQVGDPQHRLCEEDGRRALGADPGSFVKAGPASAVWRVLDVERLEVDVPESHPDDRIPYVQSAFGVDVLARDDADAARRVGLVDACLRSAQIDRDELATLPTFGQPGYGPTTADRVEQLRLSARLWEEQAQRAQVGTMATNSFRVMLEAVDPHDVPPSARVVELPLPVMLLDGSEPMELRSRREIRSTVPAPAPDDGCRCWNEGQYGRVHREDCPLHRDEVTS